VHRSGKAKVRLQKKIVPLLYGKFCTKKNDAVLIIRKLAVEIKFFCGHKNPLTQK